MFKEFDLSFQTHYKLLHGNKLGVGHNMQLGVKVFIEFFLYFKKNLHQPQLVWLSCLGIFLQIEGSLV